MFAAATAKFRLYQSFSHAIRAKKRAEEEREEDVPQEKSEESEPIVSHWDGEEK
ncbi:MAG TPA: hypothetical protein H9741_07925 [Candidatus Borkfalkia faecipullorum]|uniref:Uncharacterized protein n=1 Tax=Candidatus Borkfalkia faecipullorum TaxID=2838510 RepID=A0A9D2AG83_9FIRM|nr:hypothetical protein [Candidatus Borkfalkia faecipullorum]